MTYCRQTIGCDCPKCYPADHRPADPLITEAPDEGYIERTIATIRQHDPGQLRQGWWTGAALALADALVAERQARQDAEKALRWYADRRNYVPAGPPAEDPPAHLMATDAWDGHGPGARARAALAAGEDK